MTAGLALIILAVSLFLIGLGTLVAGQISQVLRVLGTIGAGVAAVLLILLEVL